MKKLKTWQFILLIIFYPIGIIYFIVWLMNRNKAVNSNSVSECNYSADTVWVNKGSKVYHSDPCCADTTATQFAETMTEKKAQKLGLRPCKKCNH